MMMVRGRRIIIVIQFLSCEICTLLNSLFRIKISKAEEGAADQGTEAEDVEPWRGKHRGEGQVRSDTTLAFHGKPETTLT